MARLLGGPPKCHHFRECQPWAVGGTLKQLFESEVATHASSRRASDLKITLLTKTKCIRKVK